MPSALSWPRLHRYAKKSYEKKLIGTLSLRLAHDPANGHVGALTHFISLFKYDMYPYTVVYNSCTVLEYMYNDQNILCLKQNLSLYILPSTSIAKKYIQTI